MTSIAERWDAAMRSLRRYHAYEVIGAHHVPPTGGVVVASTHSLATYENFLLASVCRELLGRKPLIVGDDLFFRLPLLGRAIREIGLVSGDRNKVIEMVEGGEIVGLGPGGMREAVRSSRNKYRFDWSRRLGFVWVSMLTGAPIVLAACPDADDIYTVYGSRITDWIYQHLRMPAPFFRGLGPTLFPRPVKLRHIMAEPIYPSVPPDRVCEVDVELHHQHVVARMRDLMQQAIAVRRSSPDDYRPSQWQRASSSG